MRYYATSMFDLVIVGNMCGFLNSTHLIQLNEEHRNIIVFGVGRILTSS